MTAVAASHGVGKGAAPRGDNLVFLISQPRAGSTLLQRLLATHPDVHTAPEPWIALHPLFALGAHAVSAPYEHGLARRATREFLDTVPGGDDAYIDGLRHLLGGVYAAALAGTSARVFVDKTPRYYFIIPELRRVFPEARLVFVLRNPAAVMASILDTWVGADDGTGLNRHWHDLVEAPRLLAEGLARRDAQTSVVHYESLVQAPDRVVAGLFAELGLAASAGSIDYRHVSPAFSSSRFGDQRTVYEHPRPTPERLDRWKATAGRYPAWTSLVFGYLQSLSPDVLQRMGYDRAGLIDALGDTTGLDAGAFARMVGEGPADGIVPRGGWGRYLRRARGLLGGLVGRAGVTRGRR